MCHCIIIHLSIVSILNIAAVRYIRLSKIKSLTLNQALHGDQYASPCQTSSKSVKRLQSYGDLTVFKMAAVRYLGFARHVLEPHTITKWWALSLCKIWLKSMQ